MKFMSATSASVYHNDCTHMSKSVKVKSPRSRALQQISHQRDKPILHNYRVALALQK